MHTCAHCLKPARTVIHLNSTPLCPVCYAKIKFDGERVMHMPPPPQWVGKTVYLVTTNNPGVWGFYSDFSKAAQGWESVEDDAHVWECQIGQPPVDVTDEARKLVGL